MPKTTKSSINRTSARKTAGAAASKRNAAPHAHSRAAINETSEENLEQLGDAAAETTGPYLVPGLERGLRILSEFSSHEPVLSAPILSARMGIPRTTTFRLLQTLEALGFLERVNDRSFRLGVAVLRLGFDYLNSLDLTDFGTPILEHLRDVTGYSAHLVVRDQRDVVFVAKAQTHNPIFSSMRVHVGTRLPAHGTVHGQVLLGNLTLSELQALYPEKQLERFTERTPANVEALYRVVIDFAQRGYGVSESSFERSISVVSAPVRDQSGQIVATVAVTVPKPDLGSDDERATLIATVCGAALDLSSRFNYRPSNDDPTSAVAGRRVPPKAKLRS